jgi:hypothetical protein
MRGMYLEEWELLNIPFPKLKFLLMASLYCPILILKKIFVKQILIFLLVKGNFSGPLFFLRSCPKAAH